MPDEVRALVARLDLGAEVTFADDGHARIIAGAGLTVDGLGELMRAVPDARIGFKADSPLWLDMLDAVGTREPSGPSYELDDLNEDGSWKPGRHPEGWGPRP